VTTRLCAEMLEERVAPGSRWIDIGTGSGILALVAAHCGAREVLAIDPDPDAVDAARAAVAANDMAERVEVAPGALESLGPRDFDGAAANLSAEILTGRARELAGALRPGGALIASGFLVEEAAGVGASLEEAGLDLERAARGEGWGAVAARLRQRG
jgi:ribosomal protein L11 methyltransferase